jgi:hypothetical protein
VTLYACVSSVGMGRVLDACYSVVRYREGARVHATLLSVQQVPQKLPLG